MTNPSQNRRSVGFWVDMLRSFRLAWRLLRDQNVPLITKLIPLGALAYVLLPIDLVPDAIPVLGQMDDLAILLLGIRVFIAIVPRGIVQQHRDQMDGVTSQASKDIIDG